MAQAQRVEAADDDQVSGRSARPVATFRQGGVEVSVWKNSGEQGDTYNATIRKSYKDEKSGDWKESTSFNPTDLAVLAQLSGQAFQAITELKAQGRGR